MLGGFLTPACARERCTIVEAVVAGMEVSLDVLVEGGACYKDHPASFRTFQPGYQVTFTDAERAVVGGSFSLG